MDEETAPLLTRERQREAEASAPSFSSRVKSTLASPSNLNGLEKILAAVAVFFLLLTATGFGLFAGEAAKLGQERKGRQGEKPTVTVTHTANLPAPTVAPLPPSSPVNNSEICLTPTCVTVAATLISALDVTVDPCDDFYLFSNGGWLESHPIPDGQGFFGSAQDIGERNKRTILEILAQPPNKDLPTSDQTNLKHLRDFYSSCMDEETVSAKGNAPLLDVVNEMIKAYRGTSAIDILEGTNQVALGGSLPKWDPKTKRDRLTAVLMYAHSLKIPAIFDAYPEGDVAVDPKTLVLWIKQAPLGLPATDYYQDEEVLKVYESIVAATLTDIYESRGESEVDVKQLAGEIVLLEQRLANVSLNVEDLENPKMTYNSFNSTSLQSLFPSISFKNYFASYTPRPKFPDPVIVTSPSFLRNATLILNDTDEEIVEAYFVFRAGQTLGPLLGPREAVWKQSQRLINYLGGVDESSKPPRGDLCLASLLENYGFLIGRYYVQKAFGGDSKEYAEEIIIATIQAFKDRLPELDWLDEKTRRAAEEKADAITHKIGYPTTPNTTDPASVERYYSLNLPIKETDYFGNVLRSRLADQKRSWVTVGQQMNKGMWDMIPSEVNAYYSPPANEIAFPAGILQSPYFNKDWPEYLAFGAFGSAAGHELSHAFDQMGRQYNKDGKLVDWWTNATIDRFEHLQQCLIDQYANYSVLSSKGEPFYINSRYTNGEDMADAGGLSQSFRAWSDRFDSDTKGTRYQNYFLPGLSYSREQLFYIAYAQGWARNIKPAEAVKRIRTDPHSPTNYRVIGPLSNNDDFAKAFGCKAGSKMSNAKKCKVW